MGTVVLVLVLTIYTQLNAGVCFRGALWVRFGCRNGRYHLSAWSLFLILKPRKGPTFNAVFYVSRSTFYIYLPSAGSNSPQGADAYDVFLSQVMAIYLCPPAWSSSLHQKAFMSQEFIIIYFLFFGTFLICISTSHLPWYWSGRWSGIHKTRTSSDDTGRRTIRW